MNWLYTGLHKVIKHYFKIIEISNKKKTKVLFNSKGLYLHLWFSISRSQGISLCKET